MKNIKKISALILALILVLSLTATAFADPTDDTATLSGGEAGGYTTADTLVYKQTGSNKKVVLEKELFAYNPDEAFVYGPQITYTYAVTGATTSEINSATVTDDTTDHASGNAITESILSPSANNTDTGTTYATGTVANATVSWTNTDILDTNINSAANGKSNKKTFTLDFSNVVFTRPGIYRYKITETADAYVTSGVIDGNGSTANIRYLDVYVIRSDAFTPLSTSKTAYVATDWAIYGYVCVEATGNVSPSFSYKTNGFVNSTTNPADEYHTYNLTVSKTLVNDLTMNNHNFPFDVVWAAGTATGTFQFIVETTGTPDITAADVSATTSVPGTAVAAHKTVGGANVVGADGKDGNPSIGHGDTVKYIGIPYGTTYTIKETNDVLGTTYSATAQETIDSNAADVAFDTSSTGALSADKKVATIQNTKDAKYVKSTAPYTTTSFPDTTPTDKNVTVAFTNTLAVISPTGYAVRIAPYALMLAVGMIFFILMRRRREEAEEA